MGVGASATMRHPPERERGERVASKELHPAKARLDEAKKARLDEFYTQLPDIERDQQLLPLLLLQLREAGPPEAHHHLLPEQTGRSL
jgi:hypothetical protein